MTLPGCALKKDGKYSNEDFTVEFPVDWDKKLEWGIFGDLLRVVDPPRTASINFTTIELLQPTSTEDVMRETLKQLRLNYSQSGSTIIDGRRAMWFTAVGTEQILLVYLINNGNRIYMIMGSALPRSFNRCRPIFEATANSFKFRTYKTRLR